MHVRPFKLEAVVGQYEFQTKYHLSPSECETTSIRELFGYDPSLEGKLSNLTLEYTESHGKPQLREEISTLYDSMSKDNILTFSGTGEAIFSFMNSLLTKEDSVIVQYPSFQSLIDLPSIIGCEVIRWEGNEKENWKFDIEFVKKNIKKNTRAIIVNTPHNPTGYMFTTDEVHELVEIARKHNILIFSDEIFRFLEPSEVESPPSFCDLYENAVSSGALSKSFGLGGLRVGWIATKNKKLYQEMAYYKDYLSVCNSAPSEILAEVAIRHREKILEKNKRIIKNNFDLLASLSARYSHVFTGYIPKSGSLIFPRLLVDMNTNTFSKNLLDKKGLFIIPSSIFEYGDKHFRIGVGKKNFPEALEQFEQYLKEVF